jgi:CheY-like chemotaxis protein
MHRLLLVEDDLDIRETLAEMLIEEGYDVVTASDGREGLERLRSMGTPCLVLLDLMMPIMDGWQMRAAMLADPTIADIPVVVFSGAADLDTAVASMRVADHVTKPMSGDALLEVVRKYCASEGATQV